MRWHASGRPSQPVRVDNKTSNGNLQQSTVRSAPLLRPRRQKKCDHRALFQPPLLQMLSSSRRLYLNRQPSIQLSLPFQLHQLPQPTARCRHRMYDLQAATARIPTASLKSAATPSPRQHFYRRFPLAHTHWPTLCSPKSRSRHIPTSSRLSLSISPSRHTTPSPSSRAQSRFPRATISCKFAPPSARL